MNHIIEQQKKRARGKAMVINYQNYDGKKLNYTFKEEDLETIITQTHQATMDEVVRIAKGMKITDPDISDHPLNELRNEQIDDFIEAITSNKE
jgi:hypothetical protein